MAMRLSGYSDSDWGGDTATRRSTSGYVFFVAGGPVSWASRLQRTVALSSTEAEYLALTDAVKEALWLRSIFAEFGFHLSPTELFCDNQGAICLASNYLTSGRTKHLDIRVHFIRQCIREESIVLGWISTQDMIADLFTKPLLKIIFRRLMMQLMQQI